jgi:hypothetical protein
MRFPKPAKRVRAVPYLRWVKTLPCCARAFGTCRGVGEADHVTRHGLGRKGDDTETIPLCTGHHVARHHRTGPFREWKKDEMRDWCARQIVATQARTPAARRCARGGTRGRG